MFFFTAKRLCEALEEEEKDEGGNIWREKKREEKKGPVKIIRSIKKVKALGYRELQAQLRARDASQYGNNTNVVSLSLS